MDKSTYARADKNEVIQTFKKLEVKVSKFVENFSLEFAGPFWEEKLGMELLDNPRVDAYELKINPKNKSFYLIYPDGGYVQFENKAGNVLQDGKLIMQNRSIYHVEDLPGFAEAEVLDRAPRQLEAANAANYHVEWLVSDQKAVDQLTAFFKELEIDITITYFP